MKRFAVVIFVFAVLSSATVFAAKSYRMRVSPAPITLGAAAASTLESFLLAQVCPTVDTNAGVTAGTCTASDVSQVTIKRRYNEDTEAYEWTLAPTVFFDGSWNKQ